MTVPRRSKSTLDHVEGDLDVERDATVYAKDKLVTVDGRAETEGAVIFEGGLKAAELHGSDGDIDIRGDLEVRDGVRVSDGSLHVSGSLTASAVDVDRHLEVLGSTTARTLEAGSRIAIHGTLTAESVEVGGSLEVLGNAEVTDIEVGGSVRIAEQVKAKLIDVGGSVRVGGGAITGTIDVGATFESDGPLEFNEIDVGGSVRLKGNSSGRRIDVGGVFAVAGNLKFDEIDVGGTVDIDGDAEGAKIDVGGVLKVSRNLTLKDGLEVGGRCRIGQVLTANRVEIGGSLEADLVNVNDFEVGGSTLTKRGVKASSIVVADRGHVRGPLFAERIRLGEKADVEAVRGNSVVLEDKCRCTTLYGVDVRIEEGCRVLGEMLYSGSLDADEDVVFAVPPRKVEVLPTQSA